MSPKAQVRKAFNLLVSDVGFAKGVRGLPAREHCDIYQWASLVTRPCGPGEPSYLYAELLAFCQPLHEAVYGRKGEIQPWEAQLHCPLPPWNEERWFAETDEQALECIANLTVAMKVDGLPLLDRLDSPEAFMEYVVQPRYSVASSRLRQWQVDVFRGRALRDSRPKPNHEAAVQVTRDLLAAGFDVEVPSEMADLLRGDRTYE